MFACQAEVPRATPENIARFGLPDSGWGLFGAKSHPVSRGQIRLTGADPNRPVRIETNALDDPEAMREAVACVQRMREVGNSLPLRAFVKREVMPGPLEGQELRAFIRDAATTYWHVAGTAKMGRDQMSVVDGDLKVYGVEGLRIADASIMPRITTSNTMAPCVVIGERAAELMTDRPTGDNAQCTIELSCRIANSSATSAICRMSLMRRRSTAGHAGPIPIVDQATRSRLRSAMNAVHSST